MTHVRISLQSFWKCQCRCSPKIEAAMIALWIARSRPLITVMEAASVIDVKGHDPGERVSECVCVLGRGENPRFWRDQNETKIYSAASSSSLGSIIWIIRLTQSIGVFKFTMNFLKGQVKEVNNTDVKAVHGGFYVVKISANGKAENIGRFVQTWRHDIDLCVWRCL